MKKTITCLLALLIFAALPSASNPAEASSRKPAGMKITVNRAGNQASIDKCSGPVLYAGKIIAQHNYCGGRRWHKLTTGSIIYLSGKKIRPGLYRVSAIRYNRAGSTRYIAPSPYMLQTSIGRGRVKLWYLTPLGSR